ncbi:MAG TPA: hypothetical protein VGE29_16900 [Prosthecobacter sp.]
MKSLLFLVPVLAACALVSSCSTTSQVSLDYVPGPGHVQPGRNEFSTRPIIDQRGVGAMDLGTVRTQIGTPLEHVQTKVPVSEVVTNAFGYGLQSRGMLARPRNARYIVTGDILDLYCQMLVRPYGYARVRVTLLDSATGQILHSEVYTGERGSGAYVPGSGSPVPLLRDLVSGALQDAVDRALDDAGMRGRIAPPAPPPPPVSPYQDNGDPGITI